MIKFMLAIIFAILIYIIAKPHYLCSGCNMSTEQETAISIATAKNAALIIIRNIGYIPSSTDSLNIIYENINNDKNWRGPYLLRKGATVDAWGQELVYKYPNSCNPMDNGYAIYSIGKNGVDECMSCDDVHEW